MPAGLTLCGAAFIANHAALQQVGNPAPLVLGRPIRVHARFGQVEGDQP
jgi:hypothetical protein